MTALLVPTQSTEVSISDTIRVNIPQTHDLGDALNLAVQILNAAWESMVRTNAVTEYRMLAWDAKRYIASQHVQYLKGDN